MSAPGRAFKKGEFLFKEGDKIQNIQLIQSGSVSLCLSRPKKNLDIMPVSSSQILGEQYLNGGTTYPFSAVATSDSKVVEIPVDIFKQTVDGSPQMIKVLIKSLIDRLKISLNEVKSNKMEKDSRPCPEDQVAKIYGSLYHTVHHKGTPDEKDKNKVSIEWTMCKQYAQRVFTESPKRLEQAICILVKLKLASFEMGRPPEDPEGPEQIMRVHFFDIAAIESFFEFYQYYYFKGGSSGDILKPEDSMMTLLNQFIALSEGLEADRFGAVTLDYSKTMERFKSDLSINLNADHFARLEQKGIFAKRQARQDGTVVLQFDLKEFKNTQKIWKMLKEIEKWNDKGFVDMDEKEAPAKKKADGPCCPQCSAGIVAEAKFCSECGFKIAA